ncbi:MAG: enoyl-CoA hydratase/isomerase family protein [Alphaproteobacteria bacterium]|nr:enoyl-CoA hydratase/isomerase family protein [Alphaproteobacteria bacterium]
MTFETLNVTRDGAIATVEISAPPMNLMGPALVRDLVALIEQAEADAALRVLVFKSADPDYFIAHVDVARIAEYRKETVKLTGGEPSIGLLFRYLSASRLITIAQIAGRTRGAGSEFVLACDMRFAARGKALFGQPEVGFGLLPGAGGMQHLTRLMGRGRALEAILSGNDFDADLAERYGWINRALPSEGLGEFVRALARRIASFPAASLAAIKERINAIALAPAAEFSRDSGLFGELAAAPEAQRRSRDAAALGFQTRDGELDLPRMLPELGSEKARTTNAGA